MVSLIGFQKSVALSGMLLPENDRMHDLGSYDTAGVVLVASIVSFHTSVEVSNSAKSVEIWGIGVSGEWLPVFHQPNISPIFQKKLFPIV